MTRFRNGDEFLERYQSSLAYGGLFVPTRRTFKPGQGIVLDLRMPELEDALLIRGTVVWNRRGRIKTGVRAGFGVEFCPGEAQKRDYVLAVARGEVSKSWTRRHKRLPIELEAGWRMVKGTGSHACTVSEIGPGGAFLRTDTLLPQGTPVVLDLVPPGSRTSQPIEGRVAWSRTTPGDEGFGLEFRCRDMAGKHRLREVMRRIEQSVA